MIKQRFLIDANSLITPYKQYYPFDFASGFWEQMEQCIHEGNILFLDMVRNEILNGDDELSEWMKKLKVAQIIDHRDPKILDHYRGVLQYIQSCPYYKETALMEWARESVADPWLIATAVVYGCPIVTFETPNSNPNLKQPWKMAKIPEVASRFDVVTVDLFQMMRTLQFKI